MAGRSSDGGVAVGYRLTDGVACLTVDNPPVNALSTAVRRGLVAGIERAQADPQAQAVVILGAGRTFIAGADIREFGRPPEPPSLPEVVASVEEAAKPVVAAIHGTALGGGLELAMACHARVAAPGARLGLPETRLGLIPGATGTQRLPRLVGLERAIEMMWTGEPVDAETARAAGLVDAVAEPLAEAAIGHARSLAGAAPRRVRELPFPDEPGTLARWRGRVGDHPSGAAVAAALLEALEAGARLPWQEAVAVERECFLRLRAAPESAALRYLFFAERALLRADRDAPAAPAQAPWLAVGTLTPPLRSEPARRALARLAGRYLGEARALVREGRASSATLDEAMRAWGCRPGPCEGLARLPESLRPAPLPATEAQGAPLDGGALRQRLLDAITLEAANAVAEGQLAAGATADVLMAAAGWLPRYRGGAVYCADNEGLEQVVRRLAAYRREEGEARWPRAPLLERVAAAGGRLAETGPEGAKR